METLKVEKQINQTANKCVVQTVLSMLHAHMRKHIDIRSALYKDLTWHDLTYKSEAEPHSCAISIGHVSRVTKIRRHIHQVVTIHLGELVIGISRLFFSKYRRSRQLHNLRENRCSFCDAVAIRRAIKSNMDIACFWVHWK